MHFHWSLIPALILAGVWFYRTFHAIHTVISTPTLSPAPESRRAFHPSVSILIPARNEEKNIGTCIRSLLAQISSDDEIIVVNDRSSDKTEEILKSLGAELVSGHAPRTTGHGNKQLRYINLTQTNEAWTGKNYALHQAIPFAKSDWLLFTDADTEHYEGSLASTLEYAQENQIDYLTLFPQCVTKSFWEHVIQTCSFSFMGLWFPTQQVNNPNSDRYFANGQYALIKRSHYEKIGGHEAVKEAFLEDFAMMKKTKKIGAKGMVVVGAHLYGTHMYDGLTQIWSGWRRIYLHGFERKPWVLCGKAFELLGFSVFPFLISPYIHWLAWKNPSYFLLTDIVLNISLFTILAVAWKASGLIRSKRIYSLLHALGAFMLALIFFAAMDLAITGKKTKWR